MDSSDNAGSFVAIFHRYEGINHPTGGYVRGDAESLGVARGVETVRSAAISQHMKSSEFDRSASGRLRAGRQVLPFDDFPHAASEVIPSQPDNRVIGPDRPDIGYIGRFFFGCGVGNSDVFPVFALPRQ